MKVKLKTRWFLLLFSALILPAAAVSAQVERKLSLAAPLEREIKGGESHFYTLSIQQNQTARLEIEQKGIDVSLAAYNLNGEKFIESESPSGLFGTDSILVTAAAAGEYKIEVTPADPRAAAGRYVIKLTALRPTEAQDFEINAAAGRITKTAEEADVLRRKGTREGRRQAIEKWREVIALSRIKRDKIWEGVALTSIGLIYESLGELQTSLDYYLQGLAVWQAVGNRQYEGTALNNLGAVHNRLGDREKSVFYYTESLALRQATGDRRGEAVTLNNLGLVFIYLNDYHKAQETLQKALVLRRQVKDTRGEATTLNNLGQVSERMGDAGKALEFYEQSLSIRRAVGDKQGEAVSLRNLGRANWRAGERAKGFEFLQSALELWKAIGDRGGEADALYWLAVAERERENLQAAIEHAQNGLNLIEQIRGEIVNPELRVAYFSTVQQFYELYIDLLFVRYEKTKNEADLALALQVSERARTRSLLELLQEARINFRRNVDENLLEKEQDLQDALNSLYRQRTMLLSGKPAPEQITRLTIEINALAVELENLQIKMRRENPRYMELIGNTALSTAEIQNLLDSETVLLEYRLGETRSFLWLVTNSKIQAFPLPARKEIEELTKDFYNLIVSQNKRDEARRIEIQKRLSEILLAPVALQIENKRLAIVADGILQFIPFSALSNPLWKEQNSKFLVDENEIVVLPSAGVLRELRRNAREQRRTPGKTLAVFADPIFEPQDPRISVRPKNIRPAENNAGLERVWPGIYGGKLPRLLSSRIEARNISNFLPENEAVLQMDFEASRENVLSKNLSDYRILHFATHGWLDTARPQSSGLFFSLFDKSGRPQDGFLSLSQIYGLDLSGDLVVLSACQTALGKDVRGEGLVGLTRGFMYAGARRVVASLWKVDDAATAEFMKFFYGNLLRKNMKPAAALQQAKIEIKRIPRFRAPYFWAGFTLQGDWQ